MLINQEFLERPQISMNTIEKMLVEASELGNKYFAVLWMLVIGFALAVIIMFAIPEASEATGHPRPAQTQTTMEHRTGTFHWHYVDTWGTGAAEYCKKLYAPSGAYTGVMWCE